MALNHEKYMANPPEMSGSIAKNRFRVELLWGIEKLLQCLDEGVSDFAVIFDYRCDVELHLDDGYEFYQVKTSRARRFGISWACKKQSQSGISIVGKLYELHDAADDGHVRLIIVGNKEFIKQGGPFLQQGELLFSALGDDDKTRIENAIKERFPEAKPDLGKISYLLVAMDLSRPDDAVRGHLIRTYESYMGCEARKPGALYRALRKLVEDKACEEKEQATYNDVVSNKGITRDDTTRLFKLYADQENSMQDYVMKWVEKQPPLKQRQYRCIYSDIFDNLIESRGQEIVRAGVAFINTLDEEYPTEMIIRKTTAYLENSSGIEVTVEMCTLYSVIALYVTIHGGY